MASLKEAKAVAFPSGDVLLVFTIVSSILMFHDLVYEEAYVAYAESVALSVCIAGVCFETRRRRHEQVADAGPQAEPQRLSNQAQRRRLRHVNNTMCQAARQGRVARAERLMARALQEGLRPDAVTYSTLLHAHVKVGDLEGATKWYEDMSCTGIAPTTAIYHILIFACMSKEDTDGAKVWAQRMLDQGLAPTDVTFSAFIGAAAKQGSRAQVEHWLRRMREAGCVPNGPCYHHAVAVCFHDGDVQAATAWLDEAEAAGCQLKVDTYVLLINACAKTGDAAGAEAWADRMILAGVTPNVTVFVLVFEACARSEGEHGSRALRWHRRMAAMGVCPSPRSAGCLAHALAKSGMTTEAMNCIRELEQQGVPVDVVAYCSVVEAHAKASDAQAAREVFDEMVAKGVKPNSFCFSALARAYARSGQPDEVEAVAKKMAAAGEPISQYFLAAQLSAYDCRHAAQAESAFHEATRAGVTPNAYIFKALSKSVGRMRARELVCTPKGG